jgi:hypothetical protein
MAKLKNPALRPGLILCKLIILWLELIPAGIARSTHYLQSGYTGKQVTLLEVLFLALVFQFII